MSPEEIRAIRERTERSPARRGTCVDCPCDLDGKKHPERCQYTARYDHVMLEVDVLTLCDIIERERDDHAETFAKLLTARGEVDRITRERDRAREQLAHLEAMKRNWGQP